MTHTAYTTAIQRAAEDAQVDADVVEALIWVESAGHADAFRFEPQYAARYHVAARYPQWPVRAVASSYGLMQLMFLTAVGLGFTGEPEALFLPTTNLHWGCRYFKQCCEWALSFKAPEAATLQGALCAYNGGRNSNTSPLNPRPANVAYAQRVLAQLA